MPLNGMGQIKESEVTIEGDTNIKEGNSTVNVGYSTVIKTEELNENEKLITLNIPLLDGTNVEVTGTFADIIIMRKKLEVEGKIPVASQHDDEIMRNLQENKDRTRWEFGGRGSSIIVDTVAEKEKKRIAAAKKEKFINDIKEGFLSGKATLVKKTEESKQALVEIMIVSEDKIAQFFSKKTLAKTSTVLAKTGNMIGGIIEKGIYYAMPGIEGTLPHIKKQIFMTGKQLLDIFNGNKVTSHDDGKKEDIEDTEKTK